MQPPTELHLSETNAKNFLSHIASYTTILSSILNPYGACVMNDPMCLNIKVLKATRGVINIANVS